VLRLLISAVQRHMSIHNDGATVTATLCLFMTEHTLQLSLQHKQSLVINLLDVITEAATTYLMSDQCPVRRTLQLDNLNELLQLLRGFCHSSVVVVVVVGCAGEVAITVSTRSIMCRLGIGSVLVLRYIWQFTVYKLFFIDKFSYRPSRHCYGDYPGTVTVVKVIPRHLHDYCGKFYVSLIHACHTSTQMF